MKKRPGYVVDVRCSLSRSSFAHQCQFTMAAELYERTGNRTLDVYSDRVQPETVRLVTDDGDRDGVRRPMPTQTGRSKSAKDSAVVLGIDLHADEVQQAGGRMGKHSIQQRQIDSAGRLSAGGLGPLPSFAGCLRPLGQVTLATEAYPKNVDEQGIAGPFIMHAERPAAFRARRGQRRAGEDINLPDANFPAELDRHEAGPAAVPARDVRIRRSQPSRPHSGRPDQQQVH